MMMAAHKWLAGLALLGLASPAAIADGTPIPTIEAGTSVYWTSNFGGSVSDFRERVVAVGDDWVLYESIVDDSWDTEDAAPAENLFLLFSGIDYRSCLDSKLPTREERDALIALRPFTPGDTVELTSLDNRPTVTVGEAEEYFLMGANRPAHRINFNFADDETPDENLLVLDDADLTVLIDWGDDGRDRVMAVRSGGTPQTFSDADLGVCAPILKEKHS